MKCEIYNYFFLVRNKDLRFSLIKRKEREGKKYLHICVFKNMWINLKLKKQKDKIIKKKNNNNTIIHQIIFTWFFLNFSFKCAGIRKSQIFVWQRKENKEKKCEREKKKILLVDSSSCWITAKQNAGEEIASRCAIQKPIRPWEYEWSWDIS